MKNRRTGVKGRDIVGMVAISLLGLVKFFDYIEGKGMVDLLFVIIAIVALFYFGRKMVQK